MDILSGLTHFTHPNLKFRIAMRGLDRKAVTAVLEIL